MLIRWWELETSESGTMLWKGDQSPRVQQERKPALRGKWESVFSVPWSETKNDDRLLPHQIRRQRLTATVKKPSKNQATKRKYLQTKGAKFHTDSEFCENPSCKFWHPPVCLNYRSEKRLCTWAMTAVSHMLRQTERPTRSRRKVVRKDQ